MPLFRVGWDIDVEAATPLDAAKLAAQAQMKRGIAGTMKVIDVRDENGVVHHIDLTT